MGEDGTGVERAMSKTRKRVSRLRNRTVFAVPTDRRA
jgi:hypothetical protein